MDTPDRMPVPHHQRRRRAFVRLLNENAEPETQRKHRTIPIAPRAIDPDISDVWKPRHRLNAGDV